MNKKQKEFSELFVSNLGVFISNKKAEAIGKYGLTKEEYQAIISETFYLLGRRHKELKEKTNIK